MSAGEFQPPWGRSRVAAAAIVLEPPVRCGQGRVHICTKVRQRPGARNPFFPPYFRCSRARCGRLANVEQ
eukprot:4641254-Lingulodinium_polyedra.AAC.1